MDQRRRLLALAALALLGAGWWYSRQAAAAVRAEGGQAPAWGGVQWPEWVPAPFVGVLGGVQDAGQAVADAVEDAVQAVTPGPWSPPARATMYLPAVWAAEELAGAPRNLFARQIWQESRFDPLAVNRSSGAQGIAQFMPATWAEWGRGGDVFDAFASIDAMGRYMKWLHHRHGDWRLALAAYNWGTGNVQRKGMDAAPRETREYVADISAAVGLA